jgi:hypothetical protein
MGRSDELYFRNTLVGFFDIQAYGSFINDSTVNFEEKIAIIRRLQNYQTSHFSTDMHDVKFHSWVMSDSFIFVIDTNRSPLFAGSLNIFLMTCAFLLEDSLSNKFPLRGAVGAGNFYKSDDILLSDGLVDAVNYEKQQEWFGAVITPNAEQLIERQVQNYFKSKAAFEVACVRKGKVPFKNEHRECFYLKPDKARQDWETYCIPHYFDKSEKTKRKIENSKILYSSVE